MIPLHEPRFSRDEVSLVSEAVASGWVSTGGALVGEFEHALAAKCGAGHAIAVCNGTAALHLAFLAAGVRPGDLVLAPSLTFIAAINGAVYCGAEPCFVDVDRATLGMCPAALEEFLSANADLDDAGQAILRETGRRIGACVIVHLMGHPADAAAIATTLRKYGIPLIEDGSESLGSLARGAPVGGHGLVHTLSFNGNKIVTTGGGGAALTDDEAVAKKLRHLSTQGKSDELYYRHDVVGYNYRMPNVNAALGLAQLAHIDQAVESKRKIADRYYETLVAAGIKTFVEQDWARSNYWLNVAFVQPDRRDSVIRGMRDAGIGVRPLFAANHEHPMYNDAPRGSLDTTVDLIARAVCLPSSPHLSEQEVSSIAAKLVALV